MGTGDGEGLLNVAGLFKRPRDMKNFSIRPRWVPCGLLKARHVAGAAGTALPDAVVVVALLPKPRLPYVTLICGVFFVSEGDSLPSLTDSDRCRASSTV